MSLKKPVNSNYCANIAKLQNIIKLDNCDNVCHGLVLGNLVIISKEFKKDTLGVYFPLETQLSKEFLSNNNLYRKKELNIDKNKSGYFEENGRIRCVKFRGNKSEGFFIPLESLDFTNHKENLKEGDEFDELNGIKICNKYVVKKYINNISNNKNSKLNKKTKRISRMIDNQFRFHIDTSQLYKNSHKINPEDIISITSKLHGTSLVSSNILVKRKLNLFEKALRLIKLKINDLEYDNIYSSRKLIKNQYINPEKRSFYDVDIWGKANEILKPFLEKGLTIYAEIVGFLENGKFIQKDFDYGCDENKFKIFIYRITYTNIDGKVFEFSMKQVQDWCKLRDLNAVPLLYYGYAKDLFKDLWVKHHGIKKSHEDKNKKILDRYGCKKWNNDLFLTLLKEEYLEKDCSICKNNVPDEGIVIRTESNDIESYKLKSERFYLYETKLLDKGEIDIEEN